MYMSTDRPDIQYGVNELAMCMACPTIRSMEGARHMVRYILGTKDLGLFFDQDLEGCDDVVVMTDSDWAKDPVTRKSRTAAHIYMWESALCTRSLGDSQSLHKAVEKLNSMPRRQELARAFCSEKL